MRGSDTSGARPRRAAKISSATLQRLRGADDLIEDIQRHHRRRIAWRLARIVGVAGLAVACVLAWSAVSRRRARAQGLRDAEASMLAGDAEGLRAAIATLQQLQTDAPEDSRVAGALALSRGHAWLEFGIDPESARRALESPGPSPALASVAAAMLAYSDARIADAGAALQQADAALAEIDDPPLLVVREARWLGGLVAIAQPRSAAAATEAGAPAEGSASAVAQERLAAWLSEHDADVGVRRVLASLQLHAGSAEEALSTLEKARQAAPGHMGLAADDALFHAVLGTKLAGVASVADQLLEPGVVGLSPTDRAHAVLARAVVHAHSGERDQALRKLDEAWEQLAPWNTLEQRLAIETALQAGDTTRVERWVAAAKLDVVERDILRAWGVLLSGDVMEALRRLSTLPQPHPKVGYLQALALVEQGRWKEATPWLSRTETLLPGRIEIEVARARTELRTGNASTALHKLGALAEFEPYAPRAWTGLGEAHLLQPEPDLVKARQALERAVEREPVPADALLLLAQVALRAEPSTSATKLEALRLLERAASVNPHLPKFGAALALLLADLGLDRRAVPALEQELDRPGAGPELAVALAEVKRRGTSPDPAQLHGLLDKAEARGATQPSLAVARARVLLLEGQPAAIERALTLVRGQIRRSPADVEAHALHVRLLLAAKDKPAAEVALRRGLSAAADGTKGRLYFEWARMDATTGKRRVAAPRSRRAWVELMGEQRSAWELIDAAELSVRLWIRSDKERVALSIAGQLTERLGYHSAAWVIAARAELFASQGRTAKASANKAVALDQDSPEAHEILGHVYLRYGEREAARKSYARALELAEGTPRAKSLRRTLARMPPAKARDRSR